MSLPSGVISGVSEVAFWVADVDRAVEFYSDKLGFEVQDIDVAFKMAPERLDEFSLQLKVDGLPVKGPVEFATGRRSYFFEDPDEHYIELTDR